MPFMVDWMRDPDGVYGRALSPGSDHVARPVAKDSGFYVGILASSYFWGQFVASFIWPPLSDKIGRKKSLVWGQLALTIPFMCFAISRNYWWAVFWRFINGVLQSNSPITKAYIADICDRTNSGAGMSVLAFAWGLSNVVSHFVM
jgi:MFS family permease